MKYFKLVAFLVILLINNGIGAQTHNLDCTILHEGNFLIKDSQQGNLNINRGKKYQIETAQNGEVVLKIRIDWQDECHYSLSKMKVLKAPNKNEVQKQIKNSPTIYVEIIEVNVQYHKIKCTVEGQKEPIYYTLWKQK